MSEFRLSAEAENQLDTIWFHIARESGSIETSTRVVQDIANRFWTLAKHPYLGRMRADLAPGFRSLAAGDYIIIYSLEDEVVLILVVLHGSRDIDAFFRNSS